MGNESFYRRPPYWHHCVHSLMCCSCHSSESLTSQTEMCLLATWELISNLSQEQQRISRLHAVRKIRVAYFIATVGTACIPSYVFLAQICPF